MKVKVVFTIQVKPFTVPWIPEDKPAQYRYSDHSTFTILL